MNIVSVINQKGGVAKTTTCANVGACLAARGLRTLLIDLDPQANLTLGLHVDLQDMPYGLHDVLRDPAERALAPVLRQVGELPLFVAPGHYQLSRTEAALIRDDRTGARTVYRMREALERLHGDTTQEFDWVLIDCPPSLGPLTQNAVVASRYLLVPTEAKMYALAGMDILNSMVEAMAREYALRIELLGVVLTMYERNTRLHRSIQAVIREKFGAKVFETVINKTVRLSEAEVEGRPIISLDRSSAGARAYEALTDEILQRTKAGSK